MACGSLLSVFRGCPSYHHVCPLGLPIRYYLRPSMFRSAVLAASFSSFVLWRCPYFLRRWGPIECTCSGIENDVVFVAVTWSVGVLSPRCACVSISGGPCCVHPYFLVLAAAYMCAGIPLALLVHLGVCGMCVLCRWCALRWRVVPSFRLCAGVPHTMLLSSVQTCLEYREHRKHTLVGWAAAWCSWRWFVRWRVCLFVHTLLCLRRLTRRVRAWTYLMVAWRPRALLHVFHGVVCLSLFFRVALCVWGVFSP